MLGPFRIQNSKLRMDYSSAFLSPHSAGNIIVIVVDLLISINLSAVQENRKDGQLWREEVKVTFSLV